MKLSDFDYVLPKELIAHAPPEQRGDSRLMVLDRYSKQISHSHFSSLKQFIQAGDLLVFNNTKVLKARLLGKKKSGGKIECFLLRALENGDWEALIKPAKRLREGEIFYLSGSSDSAEPVGLELIAKDSESGLNRVRFIGTEDVLATIHDYGQVPLPPYISQAEPNAFYERYQSIFAEKPGAVAAPTASLHFTEDLISELQDAGAETVAITLHVGYGTFQPIQVAELEAHEMHSEHYGITEAVATQLNEARAEGRRIIAVGTTVLRALESAYLNGRYAAGDAETSLFLYPGIPVLSCDGLITNFHLPQSSLLLLVSAFAGEDFIKTAYRQAMTEQYRFFSFGDGMLIV